MPSFPVLTRARLRSAGGVAIIALMLSGAPAPTHTSDDRLPSASNVDLIDRGDIRSELRTARPSLRPPRKATQARKAERRASRLDVFRGLGAWVDLYDLDALRPRRTMATLRRHGVRTVYLETGTSRTRRAIDRRVGPWLVAAHASDIQVVGWYLPTYANLDRDVARSVAIARFRYRGHRFDGLGIDIEDRRETKPLSRWNRRVLSHVRRVRRRVGPRYPLAAIPPPPLQMRVAPAYWAGFPWKRIGQTVDAVLLMAYWSERSGCPRIKAHCASGFTAGNVAVARRLIDDRSVLIHIIGGVGDAVTGRQVGAFVRAATRVKADGASLYDVRTTKNGWWRALRRLRTLR